jgi:biotin transporter BioY
MILFPLRFKNWVYLLAASIAAMVMCQIWLNNRLGHRAPLTHLGAVFIIGPLVLVLIDIIWCRRELQLPVEARWALVAMVILVGWLGLLAYAVLINLQRAKRRN